RSYLNNFIRRELLRMLRFPLLPKLDKEGLEHPGNRYRKEAAKQAKEFGSGNQRKNGHYWMQSRGLAQDAWREDLSHEDLLEQKHKSENHDGDNPSLWKRRQNAQ